MKIGFIGAGNMGSALVRGMISSGNFKVEDIIVCDKNKNSLKTLSETGITVDTDNKAALKADVVLLAVKPNIIEKVVSEIEDTENKIFISIAAGKTISSLEEMFGKRVKLIRVMPNTPAKVNSGMAVLCPNKNMTEDDINIVKKIFNSVGDSLVLDDKCINIATALHGSSPAYVYMFIDAMADAGVKYGLPKSTAIRLAAKAVEGSAKMVLETKEHPEKLKDDVCSPGGTTIAAVASLEENLFRATVQTAVSACVEKAEEMSK